MATKAKRMGERATARSETIAEIRERLKNADALELETLERVFESDSRKGVQDALQAARKRIEAQVAEEKRLNSLYELELTLARERDTSLVMGLDEVGRGPLAGPLVIGAVVLPPSPRIKGLNDSKQIAPEKRIALADEIKSVARAWDVEYIDPADIDTLGMTACLRQAFSRAVHAIDAHMPGVGLVLIDGNPLHIDEREINVIKGDARCASIAAASIIAKVDRDAYMTSMANCYPEYAFEQNKGYGSAAHMQAIEAYGLSPLHRRSFCGAFLQETLF